MDLMDNQEVPGDSPSLPASTRLMSSQADLEKIKFSPGDKVLCHESA